MTGPQAEAIVDLDAYRANLVALGAQAPAAQLMAVVKADGYGHGMAEIGRAAREVGAEWLGVATPEEALRLRATGDAGSILCWLSSPGRDWAPLVDAGVEVTASSTEQLAEIVAATHGSRPRVQLKVDTGLSRNGARGEQWTALVEAAAREQAAGRVQITGVWSHFACADQPDHPANAAQETVFAAAVEEMSAAGLDGGLRHLANSAAILTRPSAHLDLVRAGIAAYGLPPDPDLQHDVTLRPAMTLRGRLAHVKRVPAGTAVSYGHTWTASHETTLGLVPLGYADGILRTASGRGHVAVAGRRHPQVGRICMDQLVVDLGETPARPGDVVTLFGPGDDGEPTAEDWAIAAGTIGYEVVTRLGGRIQRSHRGV